MIFTPSLDVALRTSANFSCSIWYNAFLKMFSKLRCSHYSCSGVCVYCKGVLFSIFTCVSHAPVASDVDVFPLTGICFLRLLPSTSPYLRRFSWDWHDEDFSLFLSFFLKQNYTMQERNCDILLRWENVWLRGGNTVAMEKFFFCGESIIWFFFF